jgi:hypothetical protein
LKTFISYASSIKNTAGKIKSTLDEFGFNCFLAHEDIPPQTVWPKEIISALKECELFLPLLTQKFMESYYCQQEIGFAYCKDVEILPVMISKEPMGMIADLQAVKFNKDDVNGSCWRIVKHIGNNSKNSEKVLDSLITWFGESESYHTANERAKRILSDFDFSKIQVEKIRDHIRRNSQIHQTKGARDAIFKFMEKYPSNFDEEFKSWYDSKEASRMWMR